MTKKIVLFLLFYVCFAFFDGISAQRKYVATLERFEITETDEEIIQNLKYSYKKYNRTSPYYVNIEYDIMKPWYSNMSMNVKGYEWKNNQYKQSIISYEDNICHLLGTDVFVFNIVRQYSNLPKRCPMTVGHFHIKDMVMDAKYLPSFIPISKWKVVLRFFITDTKKTVSITTAYLKIEDNVKNKP